LAIPPGARYGSGTPEHWNAEKSGTRKRPWEFLSEGQPAARGGEGAAKFFGGLDPFLNDVFYVGESFGG
jgi:hypothetical protein